LRLDAAPRSLGDLFMISGFPSLHVAVVLLAAIKLKIVHPLLSLIGWCFVLLMVNSTLYLGWHYIWDDLGSVLLVYTALRCTRRLYRKEQYFIYRVQADA
jgi:membrane-associated phospholipid phosphatase